MKSQFCRMSACAGLLVLLFATTALAKSVTLSWDPSPSNITGYKIYYDTQSAETPFVGIDAIEGDSPIDVGNVLTYTVTGLYDDEDYYFAVTAYDGSGNESTYSNVVVSAAVGTQPQNTAPVLNSIGSKTVAEGSPLAFTVSASDVDGDSLSYSVSGLPVGANFNSSTRAFSWTPGFGAAGDYAVTFTVNDGSATDSETVTITVNNVNQAPVLNSIGGKMVAEGSLLTFKVSASDADGDSLSYSASGLPVGASFNSSTQTFSWTPDYTAAGSYAVTFAVADGQIVDSETVTIVVNNVNQAPVLGSIGSKIVAEGSLLAFSISASDADGDSLSYTASGLPSGASFNSSTRTFSWTPNYTSAGSYTVIFGVNDGSATDNETVTITVSNVNQAPVLNSIGTKTVAEGSSLAFTVSASDVDGDSLSYSASGLPAGASFNSSTRTFSWTPEFAETENTRIFAVVFAASDGRAEDSELVTINVTNVNRAPVLSGIGSQNLAANSAFSLTISGSDPDNNALTYSAANLPAGATFNASLKTFNWTPSTAQIGSYAITFSVTDGSLKDSETVTMVVSDNNSAPVISGQPASTIMATYLYSFTPLASDADGDKLTFSITGKPSWASFDTSSGRLYGSPSETQTGTYSGIVIAVSDGAKSAVLPAFSIAVSAYVPVDTDHDGVPDSIDAFPNDSSEWQDTDGDRIGNVADPDDDNDGVADIYDGAPLDASSSAWHILAQAEAGGYISPEGETYLAYGESQSYQLTPMAGYYVKDLLVNGRSVGAVSTYAIDGIAEHYELNAVFEAIPTGLSLNPVAEGLAGIDRVDGGDDSHNYVDGKPKLALDYRFHVTLREASVTADQRVVYLVLDSYKYRMNLSSGALVNGAEYALVSRLGPAYAHSFYFIVEDSAGHLLGRYPTSGSLEGPVVELLDGRNLVAVAADIDARALDSATAFGNKQVQGWLPDAGPKGQFKLADSIGAIRSGNGYVIKRADSGTLPDLSGYGQITDEMIAVPVLPGWNLIGNPYGGAVALADIDVQVGSGIPVPWLNAVAENIVVDGIYSYLGEDWGGTNEFASAASAVPAQLIPWIGYWVYVNPSDDAVTLLIPKPLQ
ncbi:putative Ig domain-containing protein [Pelobacter seleniigenes]|uniref:putative Ig domain-containing protein n=1 Tax=Pelobacter seleniigenes TaxID=407188 RepID=UPI0004A75FD9|nr:putative Ig domain-containing protein [Pelobacter seleniigenes]